MVSKKEKAKDLRLRREYHITLAEFKKTLEYQQGVCFICKKKLNKKGIPLLLAVDHRHDDGLVRGLLCWPCNKAIAVLQDSMERAYNAYLYLKNPPFVVTNGERFTAPGRVGSAKRNKLLKKMAKENNVKKK